MHEDQVWGWKNEFRETCFFSLGYEKVCVAIRE